MNFVTNYKSDFVQQVFIRELRTELGESTNRRAWMLQIEYLRERNKTTICAINWTAVFDLSSVCNAWLLWAGEIHRSNNAPRDTKMKTGNLLMR